jgi:hypothetical protein
MYNWSDDDLAALTERKAKGESAGVIAAALGYSRGAIIGKARRFGLGPWCSTIMDEQSGAERKRRAASTKAERAEKRKRAAAIRAEQRAIKRAEKFASRSVVMQKRTFKPHEQELSKAEIRAMFEQAWINTAKQAEAA